MVDDQSNRDGLKRRGYLKGVVGTGLGIGILSMSTATTHASDDENDTEDDAENKGNTHNVDGDSVYLVFGADTSEDDLDAWVAEHKDEITEGSRDSITQVVQYHDVSQLNVNQQATAVSIAIDDGEATAIQQANQNNNNTQKGHAESINISETENSETFNDVSNVYIVFAEETGYREFNGWVVRDETYQSEQSAQVTIEQSQTVNQLNYSSQSAAVAIAEGGSDAEAYQQSAQTNENYQHAEAAAVNVSSNEKETGDGQEALESVEQWQEVAQLNVSEQGVAIAIAVGSGSVAEACQVSAQCNLNEQVADATAINFEWTSADEVVANADMVGEFSDEEMNRTDDGSSQSNTQEESANITQVQSVGQENISLQNAAIAVGTDDSTATARQESYQANLNAQVASVEALNVQDSHCSATVVVSGKDTNGDKSWAIAYENGDNETAQQMATAEINQLQFIEQLNVNEQNGAIAYAANSDDAVAEQLNYQLNKNVQVAETSAVNEGEGGGKKDKGKKKKKVRKCSIENAVRR
ncbi:serine-rich family protein [Natronorubrum aibiense]|uniref:Uncharacterized protein n=1 Tax=Natronorubrum aibiense TaxID=348826 RepID=A0A5P9P8F1_9EURY|nr:hypothetical protein [Natronorubrum aibiense]QFU84388.1 hypothetical protein GCU68_17715 [Natronorubrum aibiense]